MKTILIPPNLYEDLRVQNMLVDVVATRLETVRVELASAIFRYDMMKITVMEKAELETLDVLKTVRFDGDMPSKDARDALVEEGFVGRANGFNFLTEKGVRFLTSLKLLTP